MERKRIRLAAIVCALMLLGSTCLALENQIINGEFDASIEPWQKSDGDGFTVDVIQGAALSGLNALKIDISDVNAQESIMISQGSFTLDQGAKCHIGFTAKADADRQIGLLLEYNNVWAYTWHKWIDLTTSPQKFTFEFINSHSSTDTIVLYFILKHPWFPLINEDENIDAYIDGVYVVQEPPADPNLAHYPFPPDGAMHENIWAILSWKPGQHAISHDVYFGEDFNDVNNGTNDVFCGNYDSTFFVLFPSYTGWEGLTPGTTYYWRIDEVNDMHPDSPWIGDVWSFWLPPYTASRPIPEDGTELIDPNITLSWTAGFGAKSHTLYLGENSTDVEGGTINTFKGSFSQSSYLPDDLDFDTTYYWRVDKYDGYTTHKGAVWSFSTKSAGPNIAHDPYPADGATHPETWVAMTWSPGILAVSHDFYCGYNFEDVNNGTGDINYWNQTDLFVVAGFLGCPFGGLFPGTTYYWRVDEVNNLHPDSPWKGDVWSFGITPYTAYDPVPADGAAQIDPYVTLNWKAGFHAESHHIYFGDKFDDVNDATVGLPQETTTYIPGPLEFGKTYYWRIDEYDGYTTQKGAVWSFSTKPTGLNTAYDPYPADGTELFDLNVTLSWEAGFGAKLHVLYLGENFAEVEAGTGGTFKGIISETSYLPNHLEIDKTYYWRVDEFDVTTTHKGQIWSFSTNSVVPNIAYDPYPANGAMYKETWAVLSWLPGRYAVSHDVYWGENFNDVYNGIGDTFWGNLELTWIPIGFPDYAGNPGLIPGTTYYWRIDEVNDQHPDSPWKGDIWSFRLPPYTASKPIPADGAELIDPNTTLSWTAGFNAKLHTLYLGENLDEVEAGTVGTSKGSFSDTNYIPKSLKSGKTYYWRVDEFDGYTTHKGQIWSFIIASDKVKSG